MKMVSFAMLLLGGLIVCFSSDPASSEISSREQQLRDLQNKQILVPMWGWPAEEMAAAAVKFGFQVVNSPHGNDLEHHRQQAAVWAAAGLDMLVRPIIPVNDPFDPEDVARGCDAIREIIAFHDDNPHVLGYSIAWGLYGEGGFPYDFVFTEKARDAFNQAMGTPGAPLPEEPQPSQPGSLRYVQWMEFRSKTLAEFRRHYVAEAKQHTNKLVGTWSEFYPIANHRLNMGDAPGADFLFYDLSFGDVTVDQTRAFAETHGDMQHIAEFEEYRRRILPKMAKSAGEGVNPMAFQFPMRRGHATDFLVKTQVFIDNIEDEYSLRIGPDLRELIDAIRRPLPQPEVAVVYQSFAASALPGGEGNEFYFYQNGIRQVEGILRQMGVNLKVIPYEHLKSEDLSQYKVVIVPDPMYLNFVDQENLFKGIRGVACTLFMGEYGLTHHDPSTATGTYQQQWSASWQTDKGLLNYFKASAGSVSLANSGHPFTQNISLDDLTYPPDQMFSVSPLPADAEVLLQIGEHPLIFTADNNRACFVTNRLMPHTWHNSHPQLEGLVWQLLRNILEHNGVTIRVTSPSQRPVREGFPYGSYGIVGNMAYNDTKQDVVVDLNTGDSLTIPAHGWVCLPD